MKEITEIITAFDKAQSEGRQTALVTLVHVEGSSYRRPGARMLVTDTGELTGAISGGCLEGDALNKALQSMHQQRNMLVTYDTSDEDDAVLGLGLGCNGVIQVLMQPVSGENGNTPIDILKRITDSRRENVLVTLFSLDKRADQPGSVVIKNEEGIKYFAEVDSSIKELLENDVSESFKNKRSSFKTYKTKGGETTAYIEFVPPVVSLVIVGAGNDADPVVSMASILGWQVTLVADGRDKNTKPGRFAGTCRLMVSKPENVLQNITVDGNTFFLLMTHNLNYDKAMLRELLPKNVKYIGVLGPAKKMDRMLRELADEGNYFSEQQLAAVHSPVGLNIGAESPEEIALSMIAEIKSVMSGKPGTPLRKNGDVIHPRNETAIETRNAL